MKSPGSEIFSFEENKNKNKKVGVVFVFLLEKGLLLLSLLMPVESLMALDLRACV